MNTPIPHAHARAAVAAIIFAVAALNANAADMQPRTPTKVTALFDGASLDGWVRVDKDPQPDTEQAWSVVDGAIRTTGEPRGYIRTKERYRNYRLTVEWRWLPATMPLNAQGQPRPRNSGVLLHMQGQDEVWPKSLEAQLMEGNAGDFWVIGGVECDEWRAAREQALSKAGSDPEAREQALKLRRVPKRAASSEKPLGAWNRYEIVCRDDTVEVSVNGVLQNRATNVSVREGHICLQAEGAPIEFRNVRLEPLP